MAKRSHVVLFVVLGSVFISNTIGSNFRGRSYSKDEANFPGDEGVFGTIKNSFKMAGKFLGLDAASGVANLVAEAFGEAKTPSPSKSSSEDTSWGKTLLSGLMRALSLDTGKISAIVLNAFIFLAQLLTTSIVPKNPALAESPRKVRDGTPIEWLLQNPSNSVRRLIEVAQDENLVDYTIEILKENTKGTDTSCLQLLICKMAPFVWKMQRALATLKSQFENRTSNNNENNKTVDRETVNTRGENGDKDDNIKNEGRKNDNNNKNNYRINGDALFRHLPEIKEFIEHGDMCESKYDECRLID